MVLFICTGNTCRSPMATAYFRKLLDERGIREIETRSAGVMTITGLLASQEAIQVMDVEEVDLRKHRSTQLTPELIHKANLILAMSPFHRQMALRTSEEAKNKTHLFKEFTRSDLKNVQITDPMGSTLEVFKKCFKEIKIACEKLIDHEFVTGKPASPKPAPKRHAGKSVKTAGGKSAKSAKSSKAVKTAKAAKIAKTAKAAKSAKSAKTAKPVVGKVTKKKEKRPATRVKIASSRSSSRPKSAKSLKKTKG